MPTRIYFHNEDSTYLVQKKKFLKQWIKNTIEKENHQLGEINIILCSDKHLHSINVSYLNHDTYTDIITFDYTEQKIVSGDLFISIDRIKENAKSAKTSTTNELHRVIIHGVLHLLGYKDKKPSDKKLMTSKEDFYLSLQSI